MRAEKMIHNYTTVTDFYCQVTLFIQYQQPSFLSENLFFTSFGGCQTSFFFVNQHLGISSKNIHFRLIFNHFCIKILLKQTKNMKKQISTIFGQNIQQIVFEFTCDKECKKMLLLIKKVQTDKLSCKRGHTLVSVIINANPSIWPSL